MTNERKEETILMIGVYVQVYVLPVGVYHGSHPVEALILEDFDRAAPYGVGQAKVGGNYAPVLKHAEKARLNGYGITLHLDSKISTAC